MSEGWNRKVGISESARRNGFNTGNIKSKKKCT